MIKSQKIQLMESLNELKDEIKYGKFDKEGIENIENMIDSILDQLIKYEVEG